MFQHLFEDLLIHGEGGDGGAGAAPGGAAPGAEASAVTTPVAGEQRGSRRSTKAERRAALERQLEAERAAAQPKQSQQAEQPKEQKTYTEDELNQRIQKAVTTRVKNLKDSEAELTSTKSELDKRTALLAQLAKAQYGIEPGEDGSIDIAAIEQAASRNRVEEYAMEHGTSLEYAETAVKMEDTIADQKRQIEAFQMQEEARKQDAEALTLVQKHLKEAEAFRQKVPNFDLKAEVDSNPLFRHLIVNCGVGVESAYWAAHHEELMAAGQQAAAQQANAALASRIRAGQSMPAEGGLGSNPAASPQRVFNFKGRSRAEREAFHRSVQRGDKHYF